MIYPEARVRLGNPRQFTRLLNREKKAWRSTNLLRMSPKKKKIAIQEKLQKMAVSASKRKAAGNYWFEVEGKKRYVRINSSNFRAVSLDEKNPCGHLLTTERKKVSGKILESALSDAKNFRHINHETGNTKPEHRVQASIIWQALTDPRGLPTVLKIADRVDALWFVTDELSLPPVRADVIMLGERDGRFFPVFIELKSVRTTDVAVQLINASKIAVTVSEDFCKFLSAATDKHPYSAINIKESLLLVIWGHTEKERPEAADMRKNFGVLTVGHLEEAGKIHFKRWPPVTGSSNPTT